MASNLLAKNTEFWKDVNVKNICKTPLPQTFEGVSGMEEVAEMWTGNFRAVFPNFGKGSKFQNFKEVVMR